MSAMLLGELIYSNIKGLFTLAFYIWDIGSLIGLLSFTFAMLAVANDCSSYVVSWILMAVPFIPEAMLVSAAPFLVDMGLYTPPQTRW